MHHLTSRVGLAIRTLGRSPSFAITVMLSLALGIGANSTMFTVLDAALLRPLPYPHAQSLVLPGLGATGIVPISYFRAWSSASRTLEAVAFSQWDRATVSGDAPPEELVDAFVSPELTTVLGVRPERGRFIVERDGVVGEPPVVVLGHELWQTHFRSDPNIVGRMIDVNGQRTTVVGVMPLGFSYPSLAALWQPRVPKDMGGLLEIGTVVASMKPGASTDQVQRDLTSLIPSDDPQLPASLRSERIVVTSLHEKLYGSVRSPILLLATAVGLLFLIATANIANLILVRSGRRHHEFTVRTALGAPRSALYWDVVVECLVLAIGGGLLGGGLSVWCSQLFIHLGPKSISSIGQVGVDGRALIFTFSVSVLTALLIGTGTAVHVIRNAGHVRLGEGGSRAGAGRYAVALRRTFVVLQVSGSVVLLTGAGLVLKSLSRLTNQDNGFNQKHLMVVTLHLPAARYADATHARQFIDEMVGRFGAMPGVQRVTYGPPPLTGFARMYTQSPTDGAPGFRIAVTDVGPQYFETYGIPVLSGRGIELADDSTRPPVVVVNRTAARLMDAHGSVLGRSLDVVTINKQHPIIVGIVADVPQRDLAEPPLPEAFSATQQEFHRPFSLAMRVIGDPDALALAVQGAVRSRDPELAVQTASMENTMAIALAPHRFIAILLTSFAGLAMAISAIGIFGVLTFIVGQRTREFGVRMALGAERAHVIRLVVRDGLALASVGLVIGSVLSLALSRLLRSFLYEVQPNDPSVLATSVISLGVLAIISSYVPARSATRIEPTIALRSD